MNAHEIIENVADEIGSYDWEAIKDALCDGEFLSKTNWEQTDIEEAHEICLGKIKELK